VKNSEASNNLLAPEAAEADFSIAPSEAPLLGNLYAHKGLDHGTEHANAVEGLVHLAGLIFAGTVVELGASSVPAVKPADNLIVVRVDRGLRVDKALGELSGKVITVAVRDPKGFRPGQQAVFFTNSWIHGQGIAVREVEHAELQVQDSVAAAVAKLPEVHLTDRLRSAALVVLAEVVRLGPIERVSLDRNDALWRTAELNVLRVLRGAPRSSTVAYFPTSKHPD
jgi:hypothetical protein